MIPGDLSIVATPLAPPTTMTVVVLVFRRKMTDLDLVPPEDLLKALKRRFDHMVFAGSRNIGGDQGEDFSVRSTDHSFATLGE